jgi:ABC-type branched-subunit amino acid transport system substrate-binding protein
VKQIRELGYKGLVSAMWNFLTEESLKIMGKEAVEGAITLQGANPPHLAPQFLTLEQKGFMEANLKKNGPPFEVTDFMGATNTVVLVEGIKKANSLNSDKVKQALETSEITVFGKKTRFGGARIYGQPHQMLQEYPVYVVKDGKPTFQKWVPPLVD